MQRIVADEILDSLPHSDPQAVRSRSDLRWINTMMGGERWIVQQLLNLEGIERVIELGAGEGNLLENVSDCLPHMECVGIDLQPRPANLHNGVKWQQCDAINGDYEVTEKTVVVANLFLHHLESQQLSMVAKKLAGARAVIVAEPCRNIWSLMLGYLIYPFVGKVTKHDMIVSIKAGFVRSEFTEAFSELDWYEKVSLLGGIRGIGVAR